MATLRMRGSAIAGLLATMILGCSDTNDGSSEGPLAPAEFVRTASALFCDDYGNCCEQDGYAYAPARCRAAYARGLEEILGRATVEYDAEAGGRCVQALRESPGQCDSTPAEIQACGNVFRGLVPIGGSCVDATDCSGFPTSAFCDIAGFADRGVCVAFDPQPSPAPVHAGRGDPCSGTCPADEGSSSCVPSGPTPAAYCFIEDGLYCARATSTCEPLIPEGGVCERDPRFPGCVGGTFCEHERCVPVRGEGESCLVDFCTSPLSCLQASDLACAPGLRCATETVPRCVPPKPDGSACSSFVECASRWCDSACDAEQGCADTGVCGPPKHSTPEQCAGVFGDAAGAAAAALVAGRH